jgi:hypothetical protein
VAFLQPDILPAMAEAIHRQLADARGGRLSEESLAATVVPPGVSKGTIGEKYFADTLRELGSIGAVHIADGQVSLPNEARGARDPGAMRALVRSNAMRSEAETDLWEKDELGSLVLLGARDLVRALAWFLSLDVLAGPYSYDRGSSPINSLQEQHTGERLIFNKDRWHPFVRWTRYLGFTRELSLYSGTGRSEQTLLPDPTDAVRVALPQCVPTDEWVPLSAAIVALSQALPVLDRGTYRRSIHEQGAPEPAADCSPSLTLALERLAAAGEIEFEVGAGDAEKVVFANNRGAFHALRISGAKR